jgi:hypothetical protein
MSNACISIDDDVSAISLMVEASRGGGCSLRRRTTCIYRVRKVLRALEIFRIYLLKFVVVIVVIVVVVVEVVILYSAERGSVKRHLDLPRGIRLWLAMNIFTSVTPNYNTKIKPQGRCANALPDNSPLPPVERDICTNEIEHADTRAPGLGSLQWRGNHSRILSKRAYCRA